MIIIENIIGQHAEQAASLWAQRDSLVLDDPPDLEAGAAIDHRLEISLDGLRVAGTGAWPCVIALYEAFPGKGELFVVSWTAIEFENTDYVAQAVEIGRNAIEGPGGLLGALAWHTPRQIAPWVRAWIDARDPFKRFLGVSACIEHSVDPKLLLPLRLRDPDASVRAASLRLVAKLGRADLAAEVRNAGADEDPQVRFWAAWALSELGSGDLALPELRRAAMQGDDNTLNALRAAVKATPVKEARSWIGSLYSLPQTAFLGVRAAGMLGDRSILPWLIDQMDNPALAVTAGASFLELFPEARQESDLFTNDPGEAGPRFEQFFGDRAERVPLAGKILEWGRRQGHFE
ncbi:hypothetical protein EJ066_17645 [Mesorhizobium sp. M9A.F.Ca.ET.002.03.1.2]|uniref:HEAT repeat domain-containing protein n=1 Tax=Mesorhizobium sp. M9A.F.Ca.ET.002.03.1.2 TaxID=2493668 RepID=UPI000F752499|nr:HEAT repeat domain-containing protein [Mesorhizobium sp. M9A.F.Ca.ET.002.03.1.2]AZN98823.1 hypothetical protein EJ066_17645 [Mesorhizobium sp. M9A.F.Ca.ET.002.03.1.2]